LGSCVAELAATRYHRREGQGTDDREIQMERKRTKKSDKNPALTGRFSGRDTSCPGPTNVVARILYSPRTGGEKPGVKGKQVGISSFRRRDRLRKGDPDSSQKKGVGASRVPHFR